MRSLMRSLRLTAARKCDSEMIAQVAAVWTVARVKAFGLPTPTKAPTAPSRPTMAVSISCPSPMTDYERHQPADREIDVGDRSLLLLQDRAAREAGCAQM